jgi:hypothetical protein
MPQKSNWLYYFSTAVFAFLIATWLVAGFIGGFDNGGANIFAIFCITFLFASLRMIHHGRKSGAGALREGTKE